MRAFAIAAATVVMLNGSAAAQVTALTNATLIDGTGAAPQSGVTIVMQSGRITRHRRGVTAPAGATIVDLSGKYVVPGIINGHGHVGPAPHERQVRQYALYGVTTTTSMASDPDAIVEYKARTRAGDIRGSRVLTTMYRFTTMQAAGAGYDYKTPDGRARQGRRDRRQGRRRDQGLGRSPRAARFRGFRARCVAAIVDQGAQAQPHHRRAYRRARRRQHGDRRRRAAFCCITCATRRSATISSPG